MKSPGTSSSPMTRYRPCAFSPAQMDTFRDIGPLHACQPPYNLFERGIEADVLPYCRENGITILAYGALCRGLLSGRMGPDTRFDGDDLRQSDPKFQSSRFDQYLAAVRALDHFARERFEAAFKPVRSGRPLRGRPASPTSRYPKSSGGRTPPGVFRVFAALSDPTRP